MFGGVVLDAEFCKFGSLRSVWVARKPPGFAFIEFQDPRDAEDATRELDGTALPPHLFALE